jgi:hypothetical protein
MHVKRPRDRRLSGSCDMSCVAGSGACDATRMHANETYSVLMRVNRPICVAGSGWLSKKKKGTETLLECMQTRPTNVCKETY